MESTGEALKMQETRVGNGGGGGTSALGRSVVILGKMKRCLLLRGQEGEQGGHRENSKGKREGL